ncbi:DgyrCDS2133 [Dimorphilus gyrociliatus]|uniref:long-chain-fatty-acid--CoA ligase n=1 Tax=Dimorphilus gyrociliatus TaxID=2664684 RepID=A0A7I8V9B5_9ANNE|nr:DgyrCDS2133 [Dimorphilus gyrociliatus]
MGDEIHYAKGWEGRFRELFFDDVTTVYEGFLRGLSIQDGNKRCLGVPKNKCYTWFTYRQVHQKAQHVGSYFSSKLPESNDENLKFVGLFSANCLEWDLTDLACSMFSLTSVPIYHTSASESTSFIINQTELSILVVDTIERVQFILDSINNTPSLKEIIVCETNNDKVNELNEKYDGKIKVTAFESLLNHELIDVTPPEPDNVFSIVYTSGTTGYPKGVIVTHKNMIATGAGLMAHSLETINEPVMDEDDIVLSFLPSAHAYERLCHVFVFMYGASIGYSRNDPKLLLEDLQCLKPTFVPMVPRLLNRIYDKINSAVGASFVLKRKLFEAGLNKKLTLLQNGIVNRDTWADKLVFRKICNMLGGRVKRMTTGSAPVSADVLKFTMSVFGCLLGEGYGQTECSCVATFTDDATKAIGGHVGKPLSTCAIKLFDVPEMEYFAKNNQGEVCIKGPIVTQGYYKNPETTAATYDSDGWLHTGDIGQWTEEGNLKIIDRCKHIFKLAQGEYVAPEYLETIYTRSPYVAQCFVEGDSMKTCTVAIVVPDEETVMPWAKKNKLNGTFQEVCENEKLREVILADMRREGKKENAKSYEQIKAIKLITELFSVENNILTPTFKLKRAMARKIFKNDVDTLYEELDAIEKKAQEELNSNTNGVKDKN